MRVSVTDAVTKAYLSNAERFADAFNFWLYDKFRTGLGAVMQFIKHQQDESMEWMEGVKRFEAVDRDTASLIKTATGADISLTRKESRSICGKHGTFQ